MEVGENLSLPEPEHNWKPYNCRPWPPSFSTPDTLTAWETKKVHFGVENTITAAKISLAVKTLRAIKKST